MPFFETPSAYACHYELHGDGEAKVLLIMGFACCRLYWSSLVERLLDWGDESESPSVDASSSSPSTRKQNRYQICIYDSRGFGQSGDSLARYSSSNLARDAKALLMHLRWIRPERDLLANDLDANSARAEAFARMAGEKYTPPPLHIVGWSMGGMIATELTLDLRLWSELRRTKYPNEGPACDFRSSVLTATSRGGFTHRGESHDAEPLSIATNVEQDTAWSLRRWWRRSKLGRWRWGRTWFLRNLPPIDGLVRIFRVAFLSFYHSRIERVLELHYSQAYLDQPFRAPKHASTPSASALSHLPINSAALTSSSKPTIEVHTDRATGVFSLKQEAEQGDDGDGTREVDSDEEGSDSSSNPSTSPPSVRSREIEVEERASPEEIVSKPSTVELTPAEKYRLLKREEEQEASATSASSLVSPRSASRSPSRYPSSPSQSGSRSVSSSSTQGRVLTNREVLSSQYLLRSPFDRYIVLYLFALFGHGLTCLTHHVSRARIREFLRLQEKCKARKEPHLLRLMCITGSSDILVHPSNSFHLSVQFDCPLYVLEGVGHMVHVEEPEVYATLLHAFFTRQKVQHLQGYHPRSGEGVEEFDASPSKKLATPPTSPPQLHRTQSEGASNLTVTPMDVHASALESGLSNDEALAIAARGGGSRRNSYLVQIDDPTTGMPKRTDSKNSLASAGSFFSARQSRSTSLSSRRGSFSALAAERKAKQSCLARAIHRLTNLPLATAAASVNLALSAPRFCWGLIRHPTTVLDLPALAYGAFKQRVGGAVLKRTSSFSRGDAPSARVMTG